MRVLITGSGGVIGSHTLKKINLSSKKAEVISFKGDLANMSQTQDIINNIGSITHVIHLGAMVSVDAVKEDPAKAYSINVGGTVNLLSAINQTGQTPHIFHCSTAHVYAPNQNAISEDFITTPVSLYGRTKLMAEIAAKDICKIHGIPLCIGRVFSIHDPSQRGPYLMPSILKRLLNEDLSLPFNLTGANSIRDFLSAEDVSNFIAKLSFAEYCGTINIGSGRPTLISDFVQGLTSQTLDIRHNGNQNCLLANVNKLNKFLEE